MVMESWISKSSIVYGAIGIFRNSAKVSSKVNILN
jgi:hypothetical protein